MMSRRPSSVGWLRFHLSREASIFSNTFVHGWTSEIPFPTKAPRVRIASPSCAIRTCSGIFAPLFPFISLVSLTLSRCKTPLIDSVICKEGCNQPFKASRRHDSGSPCRTPLVTWKGVQLLIPFTITVVKALLYRALTVFMNWSGIPKVLRASHK
ncbi:hypothetical protein EV361DRAFT_549108 [Lentinula raphanica]|nr:hypothetical protein EV361DRAFT_549108 [Lentinula raphanica]